MHDAPTILVIDDDGFTRFCLVAFLEDSGFSCLEAGDGVEGLERFAQGRPDLVVTDARMPRMGGLELVAALRSLSPGTPVIMLSGADAPAAALEAKAAGARAVLVKPLQDMQLLLDAIQAILSADRAQGSLQ
jgi:CheY-like chemotaxis protein